MPVRRPSVPYDPGRKVVLYTAIVRLSVEYSDIEFNPDVEPAVREAAIRNPPAWTPEGWPPGPYRPDIELQVIALKKLLRLFDFMEPKGHPSAAAIRASIHHKWPQVAQRARMGIAADVFTRIDVAAVIWEDAEATWEYSHDGRGAFPPGISTRVKEGEGSELDLFVQRLVRADLTDRLAILGIE